MASAGSPYFRASGVCDWCCGTKASNVSSLSARCAGIVLPARRQCVAPSFEMFGPRDGRSEPRPASLIRGEALSCAKQKNIATAKNAPANAGDVWTWTAIDADTKLIPSWFVGGRDSDAAIIFMDDLASRLANRVQLTSDGHRAYLEAVEGAFGADIDYAQLVKLYGESPEAEKRYSPAVCIGAHKNPIEGNPRSEVHQHVICRAATSQCSDAHPPVYSADQCVLKEGREPRAFGRAVCDVL